MSSAMPPSVTTSSRFFIAIGVTEVIGSTPSTFTSSSCATNAKMPLSSSFRCSTSLSFTAMRARCAMPRTVALSTDIQTSSNGRALLADSALAGQRVRETAAVHLDGDMREPGKPLEARLEGVRRLGVIRNDGRDQRGMARADPPEVQVAHEIALDFQPLA